MDSSLFVAYFFYNIQKCSPSLVHVMFSLSKQLNLLFLCLETVVAFIQSF